MDPQLRPGTTTPSPAHPTTRPLRVAVVEDDRRFREHLVSGLASLPDLVCTGAYGSAERFLAHLSQPQPDVLLLDLNLPGISGEQCIRRLADLLPSLRIVVLTVLEDPDRILEALEAGACAYLTKNATPDEIVSALRQAGRGGGMLSTEVARRLILHFNELGRRHSHAPSLAPRERDVLELLARGLTYKEIAAQLHLSPHTVNDHLKSIYTKLHVHSRTAAIARFYGHRE